MKLAAFFWTILALPLMAAAPVIEIPSQTPLGKELLAKVATNAGDRVAWLADNGSTVVKIGDGRAHVFATPGTHEIKAILIPPGDADPAVLSATYMVGDVGPVVVKTLVELAGLDAAVFAEITVDAISGLDQFTTVAQVQKYYGIAYDMASIRQDHPAALEIKKRIDAAASGSLTDTNRKSLQAALAAIVSELGAKPPVPPGPTPPPVTEGKRIVIVLHEVDDDSADFANFRVSTANNSTAAQWFRSQGHIVQFLEEEQKGANGEPLPLDEDLKKLGLGVPAVFVLDPATKTVLYKQKLEPGVTADNLVEYTKRGGG
jgi:hypothetical protein